MAKNRARAVVWWGKLNAGRIEMSNSAIRMEHICSNHLLKPRRSLFNRNRYFLKILNVSDLTLKSIISVL